MTATKRFPLDKNRFYEVFKASNLEIVNYCQACFRFAICIAKCIANEKIITIGLGLFRRCCSVADEAVLKIRVYNRYTLSKW